MTLAQVRGRPSRLPPTAHWSRLVRHRAPHLRGFANVGVSYQWTTPTDRPGWAWLRPFNADVLVTLDGAEPLARLAD